MNYADIIWKLVERLIDEKDKEKSANKLFLYKTKEIHYLPLYLFLTI